MPLSGGAMASGEQRVGLALLISTFERADRGLAGNREWAHGTHSMDGEELTERMLHHDSWLEKRLTSLRLVSNTLSASDAGEVLDETELAELIDTTRSILASREQAWISDWMLDWMVNPIPSQASTLVTDVGTTSR